MDSLDMHIDKLEEKWPLWRPRNTMEDNNKDDLKNTEFEDVNYIQLYNDRIHCQIFLYTGVNFRQKN